MHPAGPLNINFTAIFIGQGTLPTLVRISASRTADSLDSQPQNRGAPVFAFSRLPTQVPHSLSPSPQATISPQQKEQNPKKQPAKQQNSSSSSYHLPLVKATSPSTLPTLAAPSHPLILPHHVPQPSQGTTAALISLSQPQLWGYHRCNQQLTSC